MNRRDFLSSIPLALATGAFEFQGPVATTSASHDLDFASALSAAEAIRKQRISSFELTRRVFDRIDRYNPRINAFVFQLREQALAQAKLADEAQARGRSLGVFHGVPVHVKESFAVAGHPCTWGFPPLRDTRAPRNSAVVERLLGAGAVLIGATNVPTGLADWQSYNPIYGTTNNPWDVKRSPGGSSGGSAAALAAGLGYLSVGSDIGGSIRVPAHFCGIFGHKPTLDLVDMQGHLPGGQPGAPGFSTLLAVAGPLARSAADLLAAIKVLGGPDSTDARAWKWNLPEPRARSLKDFRVGYVIDDPIAPPTPEVKALLEKTIATLGRAGARLVSGWPPGLQPAELLQNYLFHLGAFFYSTAPPEEQARMKREFGSAVAGYKQQGSDSATGTPTAGAQVAGAMPAGDKPAAPPNPQMAGALSSFAGWQAQNFRRLGFRAQWQAYFEHVDVFLSPVTFNATFPHDHSDPQDQRTISTAQGPRRYMDMINWIAPATLTGCPATIAPVGKTPVGLPVGMQIMGPYWEDATTITFADLLAREEEGFVAPPGYGE